MSNVRSLGEVKAKPDPGLIDFLESLLSKAKDGKILALVVAGECSAGKVITGHSIPQDRANIFQLVGAMHWKMNQIRECLIDAEEKMEVYSE